MPKAAMLNKSQYLREFTFSDYKKLAERVRVTLND